MPLQTLLDKKTIDEFSINQLSGLGVCIDISEKAAKDPDTTFDIKDIKMWEKKYGKIPKHAVVIMNSGWHRYYGDSKKYYGREEGYPEDDVEHMHFPGFSPRAIEFLAEKRDIVGVAVDTISIDKGQYPFNNFEAHRILAEHNLWGIENIANLDVLPPRGFLLYNMPMKFKGGSGSPSRVFAVLPGERSSVRKEYLALVRGGSSKTKKIRKKVSAKGIKVHGRSESKGLRGMFEHMFGISGADRPSGILTNTWLQVTLLITSAYFIQYYL